MFTSKCDCLAATLLIYVSTLNELMYDGFCSIFLIHNSDNLQYANEYQNMWRVPWGDTIWQLFGMDGYLFSSRMLSLSLLSSPHYWTWGNLILWRFRGCWNHLVSFEHTFYSDTACTRTHMHIILRSNISYEFMLFRHSKLCIWCYWFWNSSFIYLLLPFFFCWS